MSTLTIKKIDETTISISSDTKGVINELSDFFSFYAPGYKYDKRFQNHIWDGKIRLVNLRTETAPQGLTSNIIKFCNDRGYQFIDETEKYLQNVVDDISNIDQWIEDLKLPFSPRDYQIAAVKQAIRSNKTMLISATGSGKSCIIYLIVRWMLEKDRKVCLIVPSTSLVEQMLSDFKDYSKLNGWDVDKHVRGLYSKIKTTDPYEDQCVITTWQSICKYDNQLFESWDCVMVDEAHGAKSTIIARILSGATNAKFKIGLTGTLANCVCHEFQLTGLFGSPFVVATTKQLQDKGQLNKMKIYMVVMKYPADECKKVWNDVKTLKKTYSDEVEYVNNHAKRQLFVRNLVCSLKGTTLVLFRLREHGEQLYKLIKDKVGDDRPVFHIDGKVDAKTREQIRNAADSNKDCILVFSVATSATGINIKSIENLIINPSKSKIQTLQSIGRSLRLCEGKQHSKVFDLVDDLSTGRHKNYLVKHSMERYQVYCDQGFDVEFKQVQF